MHRASFDAVVCTFSLCGIPDYQKPWPRWYGYCDPAGCCCLPTHVASSSRALRAGQRVLGLVMVPLGGEHFLRHPIEHVRAAGLRIERHDRFAAGGKRSACDVHRECGDYGGYCRSCGGAWRRPPIWAPMEGCP